MLYKLKALKQFKQHDGSIMLVSPTHEYIIRENEIRYHNLHSKQTSIKYCNSLSDCFDWIYNTHVPSKLKEFFDEVPEVTNPLV